MPTYLVYHQSNSLTKEQKQGIAKGITDAHLGSTNAPRFFVKVIFSGRAEEDMYSGGEPDPTILQIVGYIRAGRDAERRKELVKSLYEHIAVHGLEEQYRIGVQLIERPAENVTIEGAPMPAPGSAEEKRMRDLGHVPDDAKY